MAMIRKFSSVCYRVYKYNEKIPGHGRILKKIIRYVSAQKKTVKDDIAVVKYEDIPVSNIRNFSIIAHIDHGKSTLADRFLEVTGTVNLEPGTAQVLDRLQVEKERGITVKAVTASLQYKSKKNDQIYLLNLIDTPGHVDFANEVGRSLAACQSVVLLVDANQGVQAQTFANFYLAFVNDLIIIPVLNKIDLKNAKPELVVEQLHKLFEIKKEDILKISAKTGAGVEDLLEQIIERAPPPVANRDVTLRALLFDCWFDKFEGVTLIMFIKDGKVKKGDVIASHYTGNTYTVKNVGILRPVDYETVELKAGQVGFIYCNMRSLAHAHIGDTFYLKNKPAEPFPSFKPNRPMVFAGLYPVDPNEQNALRSAIEKLKLTDSAVTVTTESSPALGHGWRLGFLGLLHLEVFNQRLDQEYGAQTIMTSPSVTYKVRILGKRNIKEFGAEELIISNPTQLPNSSIIAEMMEPVVLGTIILPNEYMTDVISLCLERRGEEKSVSQIDDLRTIMQYTLPLNEIIVDFHDKLKNVTSGYASFDYEDHGYVKSDLTKLEIHLNGEPVEELAMIVHASRARTIAGHVCQKLTEVIPRQQFKIAIQGVVGKKIISRETIKPFRKDVLGKLYGGDATRRYKLLARQAEGKRRMRMVGKIEIPRDAFIQLLKQH